jgi:type IV pilus assembly protein PilM
MTKLKSTAGPKLACEITTDRIIAARATDDGSALESYTARGLASGAILPRLADDNVGNADLLKQAVSDALTTVGAKTHDVIAILPDASVRVALLEFDTLPDKKQDVDGVIRFRLKKSLPFDVDRAAVSYDIQNGDGKLHVVAAVVLASVLAEYENLFRELGFAPGVVLPSALASLGNVEITDPTLVIKVDAATTTLAIVSNHQLMLFRTLENQGGPAISAEQLVPDVHASLVFFQDTYNMRVDRILVGGLLDADSLGNSLESQTGVRVQNLVDARHLGSTRPNFPGSSLAGVIGALLG